MPQTPLFPLVDGLLDGQLSEILRGYRDEGLSPAQIRDHLVDEHKARVSVDTVRRWLADLEPAAS